jgi:hypothetical protein
MVEAMRFIAFDSMGAFRLYDEAGALLATFRPDGGL